MIALALTLAFLHAPIDRAVIATADRVAQLVPGFDERMPALIAVAAAAREAGDVARARYLVDIALDEIPRFPSFTGVSGGYRSELEQAVVAAAIADGCERPARYLDASRRIARSEAMRERLVIGCAEGGHVEAAIAMMPAALDSSLALVFARAFTAGRRARDDAHLHRLAAALEPLRGREPVSFAVGGVCLGALWRLQGHPAEAERWAEPLVSSLGGHGVYCLVRYRGAGVPRPEGERAAKAYDAAIARHRDGVTPLRRAVMERLGKSTAPGAGDAVARIGSAVATTTTVDGIVYALLAEAETFPPGSLDDAARAALVTLEREAARRRPADLEASRRRLAALVRGTSTD